LEQAGSAIDHWTLDQFNSRQICGAVQASYKQARKALAKATANPTTENFHAFRSRAKTLWYQLRILRPINPVVLKTLSDDLRSLGDLLGRAHDLSFLGDRLRSEHGKSEWQREGHKLLAVIEVSHSDLQRGAAELAEHFFAERPRDFGSRVMSWLQEWEGKSSHSLAKALVT
jgi:CHAD domain-containing protein